jgi:RNA polymerase sigma-70 factor, ECF subfamily
LALTAGGDDAHQTTAGQHCIAAAGVVLTRPIGRRLCKKIAVSRGRSGVMVGQRRNMNDEKSKENRDDLPDASWDDPYATRASLFDQLKRPAGVSRDEAWGVFRRRYAPMIAGFASKCGASRQDIDDIIQDVMTAFVSVEPGFVYDPAKGRFRGWLKTCTVRAAIRRHGKNLRFQGVPLTEVPDAELAVDALWNDVWEDEMLRTALRRLRETTESSTTFRAFEEYVLMDRPAEDVAQELGLSVDNVHQIKSRLTKRLRGLVEAVRRESE